MFIRLNYAQNYLGFLKSSNLSQVKYSQNHRFFNTSASLWTYAVQTYLGDALIWNASPKFCSKNVDDFLLMGGKGQLTGFPKTLVFTTRIFS